MEIRTVLLVDDEPDIRQIAELSLRMVGKWDVTSCGAGAEAIERASLAPPDLVLLDVMMPGMDGPETLRRLRAVPRLARVPVIFMTAKAQKHEIDHYLGLGAAGVIVKPFDPMTLAGEIRAIVRLDSGLASLRDDYAARLPEKLDAIESAIRGARERPDDSARLADARQLAHKLSGTAGAYGFPEVGVAAGRVESALGLLAFDAPRWDEALAALDEARAAARNAG